MDADGGRREFGIDIDLLHFIFASLDQGFCLCEAIVGDDGRPCDYRFLAVNPLFERMTGLADAEGRRALELVPDLEPFWIETYGRVAIERRPIRFRNEAQALGRAFEVSAVPVDPARHFVLVFRDITEEERVAAARDHAEKAAATMLDELNHRVMNSLGMIAAMIGLEARGRAPGEGRQALERVGERVHAVADLYRTLSIANLSTEVRADDYLGRVIDRLAASVGGDRVTIAAEIEPVDLPTQMAVPLGLVLNEVLTARLRRVGRGGPAQERRLRVSLARADGMMRVSVLDPDGPDAPPEALDGTARKLLDAFVQQLGGVIREGVPSRDATLLDMPLPKRAD